MARHHERDLAEQLLDQAEDLYAELQAPEFLGLALRAKIQAAVEQALAALGPIVEDLDAVRPRPPAKGERKPRPPRLGAGACTAQTAQVKSDKAGA